MAPIHASGQTYDYFAGQDVTITTSGEIEGPSNADALGSQSAPTYGTRFEGWSGNVLGAGADATYVYSADPSIIDTSQKTTLLKLSLCTWLPILRSPPIGIPIIKMRHRPNCKQFEKQIVY
jgi:hypothetical protein